MSWERPDHDAIYDGDRCRICLTLIIVTRGDVDLTEPKRVNEWVCVTETIVWDNSRREDLGVYGRYAAIAEATNDVILVVDDDVHLWPNAVAGLVAAYQPGHVVCNMPERFREHYSDSALVGFGAIFDRDLPLQAFDRFMLWDAENRKRPWVRESNGFGGVDPYAQQEFYRECDTVFTMLTPRILVDVPYTEMPWANDANRLWKQANHFGERQRMRQLVRQARDA